MKSCFDELPQQNEGILSLTLRRWLIQRKFFRRFGRYVDFDSPATFQEKIQYRKLFGDHALYAMLADKYRVRNYVKERVGEDILIPLLGVFDRLSDEVFRGLPNQFIIKANHGCKWHKVVQNKSQLNTASTIRHFNRLLRSNYARVSGEYHYQLIQPRILVEELLVDHDDSPADYNFFCFHNRTGFEWSLAVTTPRKERFVYFDGHWNVTEGTCTPEEVERLKKPRNFDRMLDVVEQLSRGFDFLRVDLYNVAGKILFGEITPTPASGLRLISNPVRAAERNSQWELDINNPLLYRRRVAA